MAPSCRILLWLKPSLTRGGKNADVYQKWSSVRGTHQAKLAGIDEIFACLAQLYPVALLLDRQVTYTKYEVIQTIRNL